MDIDVRKNTKVERIIFGQEGGFLIRLDGYEEDVFCLDQGDDMYVNLLLSDIPNLIKALQKAQEAWGEK